MNSTSQSVAGLDWLFSKSATPILINIIKTLLTYIKMSTREGGGAVRCNSWVPLGRGAALCLYLCPADSRREKKQSRLATFVGKMQNRQHVTKELRLNCHVRLFS